MECKVCGYNETKRRISFIKLNILTLEKHGENVVNSLKGSSYSKPFPIYACPECGTLKINIGS